MSKVALVAALALLLFFAYLTGAHPGFNLAYALCLLVAIAWLWPRLLINKVSVSRKLDPGTPTVGESYEETFTVRKTGHLPAPWIEVRDLSQIAEYQPGRVLSVGGDPVSWKARGSYRRRGWITFGPTSLRVQEPFGLFSQEVRVRERTTVLDVSRVTHFFAKDKRTFAVSGGREHIVDFTMAELESHLDPRRFVRIHRATIVNAAFVQELYPGVDGLLLRLKDEGKTELSVARDRVRELKERLGI